MVRITIWRVLVHLTILFHYKKVAILPHSGGTSGHYYLLNRIDLDNAFLQALTPFTRSKEGQHQAMAGGWWLVAGQRRNRYSF